MEAQQLEPLTVVPTRDVSLVGTLETWPLVDIILWANQSHRTGMLRVGLGLNAGVLFFRDGDLYRAEWGNLVGEQAVLALLSVRAGSFSLMQREPPLAATNIRRPTAELLLQLAVSQDEHSRAGDA
ncbi:MAG: DUF4388 domain-containing protein [Deltaproteobacteria bacterium]|nr:DUF4388 domain-containing protein [Deltaproteobacteria bacterium]